MTYETDGGGFKGLRWTRDDGTIATLRSAIAKHYVASMTTLETLAKNRAARLQDFYDFRRNAMAEVSGEKLKRIVILPGKDPVKTAEMIEVLQRAQNRSQSCQFCVQFIKRAQLYAEGCAENFAEFSRRCVCY